MTLEQHRIKFITSLAGASLQELGDAMLRLADDHASADTREAAVAVDLAVDLVDAIGNYRFGDGWFDHYQDQAAA